MKDIENLFATGEMAEVVKNTAQLSAEDRHAMAVYVKSPRAVEGEKKP